jgi:hypothetical protein
VSPRAHWSYVQARVQARHGARPDEAGWRLVEGAKSAEEYLQRARRTGLRGFIERIDAGRSSHAVERKLRAQWRHYVAEAAAWAPPEWRAAVRAVARLTDLPIIAALRSGATADFMRQDPVLAQLAESERGAAAKSEETPAGRWLLEWRAAWPKPHASERKWLERLVALVAAHAARLNAAGVQETSARYRGELMQALTRLFRRRSGTPTALFAHLGLVALDLERLRGGLVRRLLFASANREPIA